MFENKYLNFGYLSLAAVVFGIVISISLVNAESPIGSDNDSTQSYVMPTSTEHELAEGSTEGGELEEYEFYIKGMTCGDCEAKVKKALLACTGVKNATVGHEDGYAFIEANSEMIDADEIIGAVKKAGFTIIEEE